MLTRHKLWLIELFRQIQALRAEPLRRRLLALELQEALLYRISRAEWLIRRIRRENKELKKSLSLRGSTKDSSRDKKIRYGRNNDRLEEQRNLISVLRSIGDCVPFIYGDRWDLKQMVLKEEPGFLTGKSGTRLERQVFRNAFDAGATVVMNDLTHTMRFGDITLFRPELWPEGGSPFIWFEVKSGRGGDSARTARQMAASKHIGDYLATDKREADGGLYQRVSVLGEPTHHFERATRMMVSLPQGGWLLEEVEPGLHYVLIDCRRKTEGYEEIFGDLFKRGRSFLLSVNDMKKEQRAYYPFPISIRDPNALYRFLNGEFIMLVIVDLDQVNRQLSRQSMSISGSGQDEYPWMVTLEGSDVPVELRESFVGIHPIGRLAAEFMSLEWLIDNLVSRAILEAAESYVNGDASVPNSSSPVEK
jgi:hypothetical protein